jgi:hypothetical protein
MKAALGEFVAGKKQRRSVSGGVVLKLSGNQTVPLHFFGIGTVDIVSRIRLAIL